jgi:hypothetical protein
MKNKIKKIAYFFQRIISLIVLNLVILSTAYAQKITFTNPIESHDIRDLVKKVLDIVVEFGAIIAVFFLIYSGFLFVKAQGNDSEISKAKETFFWTIVGGMIVLGAHVLSRVIQNTVEGITG